MMVRSPGITLEGLELRSAALTAIRWGWPVVPGTYLGADRRWHGRRDAQALRPVSDDWQHAAVTDSAQAYQIWSQAPYGVLLVCGQGVSVLELPEPMMGVLPELRHGESVVPVVAAECPARWLVFTGTDSEALLPSVAQTGVRLHGAGSWVALPPTRVTLDAPHFWWINPGHKHPTFSLPPTQRVQELLVEALSRWGIGGGSGEDDET